MATVAASLKEFGWRQPIVVDEAMVIHAQETRATAEAKASAVVDELRRQRMGGAADLVDAHIAETLTYYALPDCHLIKIRTNNPLSASCASSGDEPAWSGPSPTVSLA